MRKRLLTLVLLCISACGGDASTGTTNDLFPAVAGSYQVQGVLDSPPGSGQFSGTLTIAQPSRETSALTGSANVSVTVAGRTQKFTTFTFVQLSQDGSVQLYLAPPTTSTDVFHFMGQVSGRNMSGRSDVTVNNSVYFGTFTATR